MLIEIKQLKILGDISEEVIYLKIHVDLSMTGNLVNISPFDLKKFGHVFFKIKWHIDI